MLRILHDTKIDFIKLVALGRRPHGGVHRDRASARSRFAAGSTQHRVHGRHADAGPDSRSRPSRPSCARRSTPAASRTRRSQTFGSGQRITRSAPAPRRSRAGERGSTSQRDHGGLRSRQAFGATNFTGRPHRSGRTQGRPRTRARRHHRDPRLVRRHAGLPRVPVRVALRPRGGARDDARHPDDDRVHQLLHLEMSLTVVAAMLTVIGYSLNDTIIIFDRVRENLRKNRARNRCTTRSTARSTRRCRARS